MFTPYFLIKIQILNENYITADESDVETAREKNCVLTKRTQSRCGTGDKCNQVNQI